MTNIQFGITESRQRDTDELTVIAKVRIPDVNIYNGEYGFDWLDIDSETREIKKVQGVDFSNIEYFFQPDETELGNIETVAGKTDKVTEQIRKNYPDFLRVGTRYTDRPYILAKKGQEITLHIHLECFGELKGGEILKISGCSQCSVEFESGAELTLKAGDAVIPFKIKCNDLISRETVIDISLKDTENNESKIGGFVLMENTPLKLTFRVIALVSNEGDVNTKAKKLFEQFKNNDILKYLNENSLNQAGYEVEFDNQAMFDSIDTLTDFDEFLYAFDKTAWTANGKYTENYPKKKKKWEKVRKADGSYEVGQDGYYKQIQVEYEDPTNIVYQDTIDDDVIELYRKKLEEKKSQTKEEHELAKIKELCNYNDGMIILSDYESKGETGAFSRTSPLNHYAVFVYSSSTSNSSTYAHEIGHLLGLQHPFFENVTTIKNYNVSVSNYELKKEGVKEKESPKNDFAFYIKTSSNCKIGTLKTSINNFNKTTLNIADLPSKKKRNKSALETINLKLKKDFQTFEYPDKFFVLKKDAIIMEKEEKDYFLKEVIQIQKNYIFFTKEMTKNIMDYTKSKIFFSAYQIKIMRDDHAYYK